MPSLSEVESSSYDLLYNDLRLMSIAFMISTRHQNPLLLNFIPYNLNFNQKVPTQILLHNNHVIESKTVCQSLRSNNTTIFYSL